MTSQLIGLMVRKKKSEFKTETQQLLFSNPVFSWYVVEQKAAKMVPLCFPGPSVVHRLDVLIGPEKVCSQLL